MTCSQKQLEKKDITPVPAAEKPWPSKNLRRSRDCVCVCVIVSVKETKSPKPDSCRRVKSVCLFLPACPSTFFGTLCPWINEKTAPPRFWPSFLPACPCTNCSSSSSLEKSQEGSANFLSETSFHSSFVEKRSKRNGRGAAFFRQSRGASSAHTASTPQRVIERARAGEPNPTTLICVGTRSKEGRGETVEISPCLLCGSELQRTPLLLLVSLVRKKKRSLRISAGDSGK